MSNHIFPDLPGCDIAISRSIVWRGQAQVSVSGKVRGLTSQSYPRWRYKLKFNVLELDHLALLEGLINRVRGVADNFLFFDSEQGVLVNQPLGSADSVTTDYQLVRTAGEFTEPILNPKAVDEVTVAGVPVEFSLLSDGVIRLNAPPESGVVKASFSFYRRCRLDDGSQGMDRILSGLWEAKSIQFTSER